MANLDELTIFEAAERVRSGELKAVELVAEHLERARTLGSELNAFITIIDEALERAAEIDARVAVGEDPGLLAGVPFTVKDVLMTEGVQTTAGSKLLEGFVAPYTATVVQKLLDQGAVMIGKTNCDPFAYGGSGENSGYGPTLNPVDRERVPGGSSSGAAAATAAKIGMFGIGTDTGGSVRQPASFCGVVGFKPTYGRNSRFGLIAMASSFDTAGIFAQSVAEVALIESIMAGKDPYDATTYEIKVPDYVAELPTEPEAAVQSVNGLKIGVPKEFFAEGSDPEVVAAVRAAIQKYQEAGAEIVELSLPLIKYGVPVYYVLVPAEISSNMAKFDGVRYGQKVSDDYSTNVTRSRGQFLEAEVKRRIMIGTYVLSAGYADQYYNNASKVRVKMTNEFKQAFEQVDVIMGPTSPTTAFKLGEKTDDPISMYLSDIYTVSANLAGIPGISINCGHDKSGLPIGLQIMAARFNESKLFQAAHAYSALAGSKP